jgi:hypothetical protein
MVKGITKQNKKERKGERNNVSIRRKRVPKNF